MTKSRVRRLGPLREFAVLPGTGGLGDVVAAANAAAVERAAARLEKHVCRTALVDASRYFEAPAAYPWSGETRPSVDLDDLLDEVCSVPRKVALDRKAEGLELEVRTLGAASAACDLGEAVEVGSRTLALSPGALRLVMSRNGSVEMRQFDRQCISWAWFADDLAAVARADVYLKLFMAGGDRSVNGWHVDGSDVLVTMLYGEKRFQIRSEGVPVVDTVLRPGDTVRLPRGRQHCAVPTSDVSALLSMGLMRVGDWSYRQSLPTHLGFSSYPRSASIYGLSLRPHVARRSQALGDVVHTRLPGGIGYLAASGDSIVFAAAGFAFECNEATLQVLAAIHGLGGCGVVPLASEVGIDILTCQSIVAELIAEGLVV